MSAVCEQCSAYGPDEGTMLGQFHSLHRATHALRRILWADRVRLLALALTAWLVVVGAALIDWVKV